jgi:hypothetical protein
VHARPRRGEEAQTIEIQLPLGDTTAPDLVAPAETSAGAIEGFLRAGGDKDFPLAVVRLRAVDGRSYEHFDVVDTNRQSEIEGDPGPRVQLAGGVAVEQKGFFEFQRVPAGEYELSVISTDGSRWSPNPLRLRPPRLDLEIARAAGPAAWHASFLAFDREPAEPIPTFRAQLFVGGIEVEGHVTLGGSLTSEPVRFHWPLAPTARVTWIVSAPGYRAATGTETDFVGSERDRVAPVRLERGFAARFLLRDVRGRFGLLEDEWAGRMAALEHPPVPGASVRADGEIVGTSDENGIAWIETARPPERIEILAPGWTVLASKGLRDGRLVETGRDVVVWLSR